MTMHFGLDDSILEKTNSVFSRYPEIEKVIIYGSRAKGSFKPGSDIDLTLFGPSLTSDIRSQTALELDDLLLPYEIDLSVFTDIHDEELESHIRRVGRVFYEKAVK